MKILFAHDHKFYVDTKGNYFSPGNFHYKIWERYLTVFDKIIVAARSQPLLNRHNLKISSGPNVSFIILPNLSNIIGQFAKQTEAKEVLTKQIVHVDGVIARLPSLNGNLAIKVANALKKPWAVEVVGCAWESYWTHGSVLAKFFAPIAYFETRNLVRNAKFALYVTEKFLQKRYPSYGIQTNCSNVEIAPTDDRILKEKIEFLKTDHSIFKIGFIGSLSTKTKGLETAFKALKILQGKGLPFVFEIIGNGPQNKWRNLARKLRIEENIQFLGALPPGEAINTWLDSCHLYIQPSYTEGLPRAVIEAMSRGCPVIASNVGGIPELLSKDFLIRRKDYKELAQKIIYLYENENLLISQAKNNFKTAKMYAKPILDARRNEFWKIFANFIKSYQSK